MEQKNIPNKGILVLKNGEYSLPKSLSGKLEYINKIAPEQKRGVDGEYTKDEVGMSKLFSDCYKNECRYCPDAKSWYIYENGVWARDVGAIQAAEKLKEFVKLLSLYCTEIEDDDVRATYTKFVYKMRDRRFRDRIMKDAIGVHPIRLSDFDHDPFLINCKNGTFDLSTMRFREHRWDDFLTMQTNFTYSQEPLVSERWIRFIKEVTCNDDEKAKYLQKALGYSMIGTSNEECMFILHGKTTRNGKSTLLAAVQHLLGDYSCVSPVSIICKTDRGKGSEAATPTIARLKGKRLVTMAESNQSGKLDEEVIKQLTGGEEITARNLYESTFSFLPQFTLWLSCNDLPEVRDKSLFASNRVRVIEFNRHFSEQEQDITLKSLFKQESSMQGIFSWLVEGYSLYRREGLSMPEHMKKVVRQYEKDNDLILQFLEELCQKCSSTIRGKLLYEHFKKWCSDSGCPPCSYKKFMAGMDAHPDWHQGRCVRDGYQCFLGVSLK